MSDGFKLEVMVDEKMREQILKLVDSGLRKITDNELIAQVKVSVEDRVNLLATSGRLEQLAHSAIQAVISRIYNTGEVTKQAGEVMATRYKEQILQVVTEHVKKYTDAHMRVLLEGALKPMIDQLVEEKVRHKLSGMVLKIT